MTRLSPTRFPGPKLDFLNQDVDAGIYNPHTLQDPASPYQVMAGATIAASLVTSINSDLPGRIIAQATENVYDTVSGRYLMIPQGSRVIGTYDSVVAFGRELSAFDFPGAALPFTFRSARKCQDSPCWKYLTTNKPA